MSSSAEESGVPAMRDFVAAVMSGRRALDEPPATLVRAGHLGPIAYRMGFAAHRAEYAASAIVAGRRAALVAEIARAMRDGGIPIALVKGIAYAGTIYPDPAERPMQDIDLLVRRHDLTAAIKVMTALRFVRVGLPRALSGYYHAVEFSRGGMMVELHRGIVQHGRTQMRVGDVWRRARADAAITGAMRLDPVDELLFALLHIARSELAVPAVGYVDVARLWQRLDDADGLVLADRVAEYRVARAVAAVKSMTELLRDGRPGRPAVTGAAVLPSTSEVLLARSPRRSVQIGRKVVLTEGPRELLGLAVAYGRALIDGVRRGR